MVAKAARKRRLRYIHWKLTEARERIALLRAAGYVVDASLPDQSFARKLKMSPPDVSKTERFCLGVDIKLSKVVAENKVSSESSLTSIHRTSFPSVPTASTLPVIPLFCAFFINS